MRFSEGQYVHMVGVCGVGMAGVARLLAARGCVVSGCDAAPNALAAVLEACGVTVCRGHAPEHVEVLPPDAVVVVTPAVSVDEPEVVAARRRGLRVLVRGEVLAALVAERQGIAVCGTHGKTTTSCFTARLLQELGAVPGWCIGGYTAALGTVAAPGGCELMVVEADESDGTLRHYGPAVTVLMNIDIDHLEHFDGEEDLLCCFRSVLRRTSGTVCVCRDDLRAWQAAGESASSVLSFGFHPDAALTARDVEVGADRCAFNLVYNGCDSGRVFIGVGGRHNIVNALGAVSAAVACGFGIADIRRVLSQACGELPVRRFEEIGSRGGVRYIADYAHHPVEIRAAVDMALACDAKRVIVVFQPHRYTRTRALGPQFPAAFAGADEVLLLPVYAASEKPLEGGDICDLYSLFREALPEMRVTLCSGLDECARYLGRIAVGGDLVLIAGAGDVIELRGMLSGCEAPENRGLEDALNAVPGAAFDADSALEKFSVFPTRGRGRALVVRSRDALSAVAGICRARHLRCRPAGYGFNSWFSDCGTEDLMVRLEGDDFCSIDRDGLLVRVGCAVNGMRLLDFLRDNALGGLEFMDGIPGTVGGWLAMNAGAHGGEIADCVEKIEIVAFSGESAVLSTEACGFGYRRCSALESAFAVVCFLRLRASEPSAVAARRRECRGRRIPLNGLRTAGSVFRNPPGDFAGRLLDLAGCRGLRAGGAYVTDFHANIIAADGSCSASDIRALVLMMRNRVRFRFGIELETEIKGVD